MSKSHLPSSTQRRITLALNTHFKSIHRDVDAAMKVSDTGQRFIQLRDISDRINNVVTPHTPCRKGCSACCHQAVAIPEHEARIIEQYTGIARTPQPPINMDDLYGEAMRAIERMEFSQRRYFKRPCVFLRGTECSIYNVRPIPCRLHHSLEPTAAPCAGAWDTEIAKVNLRFMDSAVAETFVFEPIADIREWFPTAGEE